MNKNSIVQFMCFQTDIDLETFLPSWEKYAFAGGKDKCLSLQEQHTRKNRFRYVSRHTSLPGDFRFVFVKGRKPEHFNDCNVRVIQAGGYIPVQIEMDKEAKHNQSKVMVFLLSGHDLESLKEIQPYQHLNVYEAYFESSSYTHILEFFVSDKHAGELLEKLKSMDFSGEIGLYKESSLVTA